ncbi:MAG: PTS ascorbate transporter subunit IIC [Clostridia bacterium]|nr:PTS ascorbate transporter subunit IIC [Clostridia bacterium]
MADSPKKQIPLRLSPSLYDALSEWAEEDFRSVNGQIEYLLTQCVRYHQQNGLRSSSPSAGLPTAPED